MLKITVETMRDNAGETRCFKVVEEDETKYGKTLTSKSESPMHP